jgi:hypothetical protein
MSYSHYIPGRLRVRSVSIKKQPGRAQAIERQLMSVEGVRAVRCKPITGSITVEFQPDLCSAEQIVEWLRAEGVVLTLNRPLTPHVRTEVVRTVIVPQIRNAFTPEVRSRMVRAASLYAVELLAQRAVGLAIAAIL